MKTILSIITLLFIGQAVSAQLFDTPTSDNSALTPAEQAADIDAFGTDAFLEMQRVYARNMRDFWEYDDGIPDNGLDPQKLCDVWGNQAYLRFQYNGVLKNAINALQPGASAEGDALQGEFTINEDGTVTILSVPNNN